MGDLHSLYAENHFTGSELFIKPLSKFSANKENSNNLIILYINKMQPTGCIFTLFRIIIFSNVREIAEILTVIEAVTDYKVVWDCEEGVVCFDTYYSS